MTCTDLDNNVALAEHMQYAACIAWDGQGQIRWQDISWEPFMNPQWLLDEYHCLLSLKGRKS